MNVDLAKISFLYLLFILVVSVFKVVFAYPFEKLGVANPVLSAPDINLTKFNTTSEVCQYYATLYQSNPNYYDYIVKQCSTSSEFTSLLQNQDILGLFGGWIYIASKMVPSVVKAILAFPLVIYYDVQPFIQDNIVLNFIAVFGVGIWEILHAMLVGYAFLKVILRR